MFRNNVPRIAMTSAVTLLALGFVGSSDSASAQAFSVVPMIQDFAPNDHAASDAFAVENNTDQPMLLSLKVMTRGISADGEEINSDTTDFRASPQQSIIGPRQKQIVRLQWQGPATLDRELAYRVVIDQEPIKSVPIPKAHAVRLALHMVAPIYVLPADAKPDVNMASARAVVDTQNRRFLQVNLANRGNAHAVIGEPTVTVTVGGVTRTLDPAQLVRFGGENILAGTSRTFMMAWPESLPFEQPNVDIKFTPTR